MLEREKPHHRTSTFNLKLIPSLGFVVTTPAGIMFSGGIPNSISNAPTKAATRHLNSAFAKSLPIQLRGPCKNVVIA